MIESSVVVKWTPENVLWFLSLKFLAVFIPPPVPVIQGRMLFHCESVRSIIASVPTRVAAVTKTR